MNEFGEGGVTCDFPVPVAPSTRRRGLIGFLNADAMVSFLVRKSAERSIGSLCSWSQG